MRTWATLKNLSSAATAAIKTIRKGRSQHLLVQSAEFYAVCLSWSISVPTNTIVSFIFAKKHLLVLLIRSKKQSLKAMGQMTAGILRMGNIWKQVALKFWNLYLTFVALLYFALLPKNLRFNSVSTPTTVSIEFMIHLWNKTTLKSTTVEPKLINEQFPCSM